MQDAPPTVPEPAGQEAAAGPPADRNRELFRPITMLALFGTLVVALHTYKIPLLRTWQSWNSAHGYNANGLYIFILCVLLAFLNRDRIRAVPKQVCLGGIGFVAAALLWSLAFRRGDINAMQTMGFIGLIWSVCLYLGGRSLAREMVFPLFLSLFCVQWGLGSSTVSLKLRLVSTQIACWMTNITGAPFGVEVLRQGTNVSLESMPDLAFDVAAACSGLQSLIMTTVLALLLCNTMLRLWWKRAVLLVLIVPVAIFNNALRIMLIAYTGSLFAQIWGAEIGNRKMVDFHMIPGYVAYGLGFVLLWLAAVWLERRPGIERELWLQRKAEKAAAPGPESEAVEHEAPAEAESVSGDEPGLEPVCDYSFYGTLWKHTLVVLALVISTDVAGLYAKARLYYARGLPVEKQHVTLVDALNIGRLNYVTAFPNRIGHRIRIETPVSSEETNQLPSDTDYYRGVFVPSNVYAVYEQASSTLLSSGLITTDLAKARALITPLLGSTVVLETNRLDYVLWRGLYMNALMRQTNWWHDVEMVRNGFMLHMMATFAMIDRNPESVTLAVIQNESDQHSIHTPEACYPAQGWQIDNPKPMQITLAGEPVEIARMDASFVKEHIRECAIYWYQREGLHGRTIDATSGFFWLPFKTAFNLIFRGRSDRWAFVRVSMNVPEDGTYDGTCDRVLSFVRDIEPYLVHLE